MYDTLTSLWNNNDVSSNTTNVQPSPDSLGKIKWVTKNFYRKLKYPISLYGVQEIQTVLFIHQSSLDVESNGRTSGQRFGLVHATINVTRHAKRHKLGGRLYFEKMRHKVNVASRKNSTPTRVSKRSLTYYKTESKGKHFVRY